MLVTRTSIAKKAIGILGATSIGDITENTKNASAISDVFFPVLHALLSKHDWSFGRKKSNLNLLSETPVFGYNNYFQLPNDYIRLIKFYPYYYPYKVEGNKISSDSDSASILYIFALQEDDLSLLTPGFVDLFSNALATEVCYKITQSRSLTADLKENLKKLLIETKSDDSKSAGTPEIEADDIWMTQRGYGSETIGNVVLLKDTDYGEVV